jgi:hypothetical protein
MAVTFEPPPSYKDVIVKVDDGAGGEKYQMDWHWVKWFEQLFYKMNALGVTVTHNSLQGLDGGDGTNWMHFGNVFGSQVPPALYGDYDILTQGGNAGPNANLLHYHRLSATNLFGITVTASPFTFTNTSPYEVWVIIAGGTISQVVWGHNDPVTGDLTFSPWATDGFLHLFPGDLVTVTYTVAPTMSGIQR